MGEVPEAATESEAGCPWHALTVEGWEVIVTGVRTVKVAAELVTELQGPSTMQARAASTGCRRYVW